MIELNKVGKFYGSKVALDDVSFAADTGNIVGLLGKNGAGKSTLMNVMTGYMRASKGEIRVDGEPINEFAQQVKNKIGYLPEKPPVYEMMTVREFLIYTARLKGISSRNAVETANQMINQTGIKDVENRLIRNLSKGYLQRVGIAQAMTGNPDILILDEPTAGLDPSQVVEFRQILKDYGKDHIIIISSHILTEIAEICDRILILNEGKLIKNCSISELNNHNRTHIFVRVAASKSQIEELIRNGLKNCTYIYKGEGEPGCSDWELHAKDSELDIRKEISAAALKHHVHLLQMIPAGEEIEDVFLNATSITPEKKDV